MRLRAVLPLLVLAAVFSLAVTPATHLNAQAKPKITSVNDIPRLSYPVSGPPSELLKADDAVFNAFAQKVVDDNELLLKNYDIEDRATLRKLYELRFDWEIMLGRNEEALKTADAIRDLQDKPELRATSGLIDKPLLESRIATHADSGPAFEAAFEQRFRARLNSLDWRTAETTAKENRTAFSVLSTDLLVASIRENIDPAAAKSNAIDLDSASMLIGNRVFLKYYLPLKGKILPAFTDYIAAHNVTKPDIWPAREVTLTASDKLTPVKIGIWDSGVDTSLFSGQLFNDPSPGAHSPHGLAFDVQGKLYNGDLQPLTEEQKNDYPKVVSLEQGFNDMDNGIDSPDAQQVRKLLASTPPEQLTPFLKELDFLDQYLHGTHVAGIAVRGNPAARLVVVQFNDALPDLPFAPTVEWAEQFKAAFAQVGDYLNANHVRVVNMSWADDVPEFETWLSRTSTEKDPAVRKQLAESIYKVWREAIEGAIRRAPDTLFVCAAGNADSNASFLGDVPASLHLPNLITVGAVDQAGEETSFTSYGDTVVVHADGYQVESVVPGGTKVKLSGTSMASPNVVNLAAKLIALDPSLTPEQTIALIKQSAETSADGRRHVINPKASVALLEKQKAK